MEEHVYVNVDLAYAPSVAKSEENNLYRGTARVDQYFQNGRQNPVYFRLIVAIWFLANPPKAYSISIEPSVAVNVPVAVNPGSHTSGG
jgi:hypothetical protein